MSRAGMDGWRYPGEGQKVCQPSERANVRTTGKEATERTLCQPQRVRRGDKMPAREARPTAEVVCLEAPEEFYAVGQWFEDFSQVTDAEVVAILQQAGLQPVPVS